MSWFISQFLLLVKFVFTEWVHDINLIDEQRENDYNIKHVIMSLLTVFVVFFIVNLILFLCYKITKYIYNSNKYITSAHFILSFLVITKVTINKK